MTELVDVSVLNVPKPESGVQVRILLVVIHNRGVNMSKKRCFVLYEREGKRNSAFIEIDDVYITGTLFRSLKSHVSDKIADLYTDRYGYVLILDFKVIASV